MTILWISECAINAFLLSQDFDFFEWQANLAITLTNQLIFKLTYNKSDGGDGG